MESKSQNSSSAIRNLSALLKGMNPKLYPTEYVFCVLGEAERRRVVAEPLLEFHERQGVTLVLPRSDADRLLLRSQFPCKMISLEVHSSLEAVGFLAVVSTKLAERGISVNAVSAFYHDHLFVPVARADEAMQALAEIIADEQAKS